MFSHFKSIYITGLRILLCCFVLILVSSCVPQRKLIYLQDKRIKDSVSQKEFVRDELMESTIEPGDELYIRIYSADERPTSFSRAMEYAIGGDITLLSYTVDEQGIIKFPYVGEIKVINMSLKEASDYIEALLSQYLLQPSAQVKFVNKNITILGDVQSPGVYTFFDKRISIFQAIGYANDINTFGNRKQVLLIREEAGIITKNYIDLTKNNVLTSDLYIVRPNDIIYVKPLSRKKWGMETYPYNLLFTIITTAVMALTFMRYPIY